MLYNPVSTSKNDNNIEMLAFYFFLLHPALLQGGNLVESICTPEASNENKVYKYK